jgi:hypothetical protein
MACLSSGECWMNHYVTQRNEFIGDNVLIDG